MAVKNEMKSKLASSRETFSLSVQMIKTRFPNVFVRRRSITGIPHCLQRLAALMGLLLLSPLLCLVALAIRSETPGGVLYRQNRVGLNGEVFSILKFRSMDPRVQAAVISDREGICSKSFKDPRITRVGKWIRKASIDELPQLWNVVLGHMALIGPRPALLSEVNQYQHSMLERLDVMPGITGLWQVSGRADTTFEEQIELDTDYVANQSFWMDISILFRTVPAVVMARGAY